MDVIKVVKDGFELFLKDIVPLMVAALLFTLLTVLSLGILGGPMTAALFRMVLRRVREGRTPQIADVLVFEDFGRYVVAFYVLGLLIALGFLLLVLPGLYLMTIWFYVFPLMVDKKLGLGEAMAQSKAMVERVALGSHAGLIVILAVIGGALGTVTRMLGTLVSTPYAICCNVIAYEQVRDQDDVPVRAELTDG